MSTSAVNGFFQSVQPVVNEIVEVLGHSAAWLNRTVQDLTRNLPPKVVPVAQLALTVAPFLLLGMMLPRPLTLITLGVASTIGFLAIRGQTGG